MIHLIVKTDIDLDLSEIAKFESYWRATERYNKVRIEQMKAAEWEPVVFGYIDPEDTDMVTREYAEFLMTWTPPYRFHLIQVWAIGDFDYTEYE